MSLIADPGVRASLLERAEEPGKRNGIPGGLAVDLRPAKAVAAFGMTGWLR